MGDINCLNGNNWYALFVLTGEEDNVKERIEYKFPDFLKVLVPKRKLRERKNGKWMEKIRLLFPGYVLVNGSLDANQYYKIKGTPGSIKLLRTGMEFSLIEEEELTILNRLMTNQDTIGSSTIFIENGKVKVMDGPLYSLEGNIIKVDTRKGRAKVRLNFLGEERIIELSVSVLQPA